VHRCLLSSFGGPRGHAPDTPLLAAMLATLLLSVQAAVSLAPGRATARPATRVARPAVSMTATEPSSFMVPGQKYGPQAPGQPADKPYTNIDKLNAVEPVKRDSGPVDAQLMQPLKDDMGNMEEISISKDSVIVLKHHGSYQQQDREAKGPARAQSYQFMLRLKMPNGEVPPALYKELDDLADKYGQGDLRATTRQAFQLHGVLKKDLKTVIKNIANTGASTLGGCGDINRNVMTPAARLPNNKAYVYAKKYASAFAELFKPMTGAFSELWLDGEKVQTTEYWQRDLYDLNQKVKVPEDMDAVRAFDQGTGIITGHPNEPIYGTTYLPRKFKIGVTVPGDNSIDLFTNDLGFVVVMEPDGETLKGFNVYVGGGMGRTHNKESTFARAADELGFVSAEDALELSKAIIAAQRDHGNREVRANARMKYLVHTLGIDKFRDLVSAYFGKPIAPAVALPPFVEGIDWLGWHAQGDGNYFVGINVQQGRIKDEGEVRLKTALRKIVDELDLTMILTPSQSVMLQDVSVEAKQRVEEILAEHGVAPAEEVDMFTRKSIACPALPLCGLAQTEAERVMPDINRRLRETCRSVGLGEDASFITRVTGCPNGCARPYMAELALVGQGPNQYQVWVAGSPVGTRTAAVLMDKMKIDDLEHTVEPLLAAWRDGREHARESFGDFCHRKGVDYLKEFSAAYSPQTSAA